MNYFFNRLNSNVKFLFFFCKKYDIFVREGYLIIENTILYIALEEGLHMNYELFKNALVNEDSELFKSFKKTNLHAHALLSSNQKNFRNEFHRSMSSLNSFNGFQDFNQYIKDNLSDLIANKKTQLKLYELSILTAIEDGVTVLDISVHYKSVYRVFNGSIHNYIKSLKILKEKYKNRIQLNYDLGISRDSYQKNDYFLLKKLIETNLFNGLDLFGNELKKDLKCFKKIYRYAKKNNMILKAHVGEYGDPKSIKRAIKILNLDVVQHGINIVNDTSIMKFAKIRGVIFNVCVTSNIILLKDININNHPIRKMYDYGLKVTINTDDELIFNSSLFNEYLLLFKNNYFNTLELFDIMNNGLKITNEWR